ncbi:MAG TPA: helix-turn-helix domain-containing protein [Devosia sp.]|jgi:transcriptional regulator with XRE-family HTH domain|nr:helix-turn-helix domain-containing protein [Devosia sp.]
MIRDPYIEWLRAGLEQPGKTQSGLAALLGLHPSAISKVLSNKRKFSTSELNLAEDYLGIPAPASELRLTPTATERLPVAGKVAAGVFREVDPYDQSEIEWLSLPPDEQFPHARRMAFDVEGDSMNELQPRPILSGDRAICVDFSDIAEEVKIRTGMVVVVERSRDGGQTREWSIKQIEFYPDRIEFCPRSSVKKYKPILVNHDLHADSGETVEIIALLRNVISSYTF